MDYYCFPTKTGDISVFFNLEQYTNSRDKYFYEIAQRAVMLAKQKNKLLLFDLRTQNFIDCNGNAINIKGKEIFPRCKIQESEQLLSAIENNGGNSIVTRTDSKIILNWFEFIDTQRKFLRTTFGEVNKNLDFYEKKFGNKFFLKTVKKGFSNICQIMLIGECKFLISRIGQSWFAGNMLISNNSTPVLITDSLSIITDDYGKREWRHPIRTIIEVAILLYL